MENLTRGSIRFGEIILFIVKLQLFWFASVIRYGIVTGIFPSTATVINYLFKSFKDIDDVTTIKLRDFLKNSREHFNPANILGFISFFMGAILYLDWRISLVFLNNWFFQIVLFLFSMIAVTTLVYVLPCYVRYEMPIKNYFKQAFYLMLCNIPSSFAIFLGSILITIIFLALPVFALAPVPLMLLPMSWFSYQAMLRLEKQLNS